MPERRHPMTSQQRVERKQPNSRMCLVCGLKNEHGLKASFFEMQNGEIVALFTPQEEHQSYPGRLHGGMSAAMLDETIGRAIMMRYQEAIWGVTLEFNIRYRKPIPLHTPLRVVGRITKEEGRFFEGTGEILLSDGQVAASGTGKYMKMAIDRIADFDIPAQEWKVSPADDDPAEIPLP
jgi:uncharacterized protein (TIGR00369 family)